MTASLLHRAMSPLGVVQVGTILAVVVLLGDAALLLWHGTIDYFLPLDSYLFSFKPALPPTAILVATYLVAFVGGAAVSEVPKIVLSFLRNRYFQTKSWMVLTIAVAVLATSAACWRLATVSPPAYEAFVAEILGGAQDEFRMAKESLEKVQKLNALAAQQYSKVIQVFVERSLHNSGETDVTLARERAFSSAPLRQTSHPIGRIIHCGGTR